MVPMVPLFFIGFATFFKLSQGGTLLMKKNLGQKKFGFLFNSQILLHLDYFHMIIFTKGFFDLDILFPFLRPEADPAVLLAWIENPVDLENIHKAAKVSYDQCKMTPRNKKKLSQQTASALLSVKSLQMSSGKRS